MMSHNVSRSPWLFEANANAKASLRLFCFPYAGGAAQIYHSWRNLLPASVDVLAVQLPGRGNRMRERAYVNIRELVTAAAEALKPSMDVPYLFFGHSMGALISFELARHLRQENSLQPKALLVSGCRAPQAQLTTSYTYNLPDPEFVDEIRRLNGTPREVLEHPELMQLLLPLLRADFQLLQTYRYREEESFDYPITAFGGMEDGEVSVESLQAWATQTTSRFACRLFPGDHFFLQTSRDLLLKAIAEELSQLAC